jgi:ureidoglycolate hydrolase
MQTINYKMGMWHVVATLQDVDDSKRIAVISATLGEGEEAVKSKHTVVFEHVPGCDEIEEAKAFVSQALLRSH